MQPGRKEPWTACGATASGESGARDTPAGRSASSPRGDAPAAAAAAPPAAAAARPANGARDTPWPAQGGTTSVSSYEAGLAGAIIAGGVVLGVQWGLLAGCVYVGACGWLFAQTSPTVSRGLREMRCANSSCTFVCMCTCVHSHTHTNPGSCVCVCWGWGGWRFTHVCAYIHVCVLIYTYICRHRNLYVHVCAHACVRARTHAYLHACMHAYLHTCTYACTDARVHACMRACMHVYTQHPLVLTQLCALQQ